MVRVVLGFGLCSRSSWNGMDPQRTADKQLKRAADHVMQHHACISRTTVHRDDLSHPQRLCASLQSQGRDNAFFL